MKTEPSGAAGQPAIAAGWVIIMTNSKTVLPQQVDKQNSVDGPYGVTTSVGISFCCSCIKC